MAENIARGLRSKILLKARFSGVALFHASFGYGRFKAVKAWFTLPIVNGPMKY